ncbi:S1/P1 nuclease [Mucilaginibacter sp. FT3.2]|uniref:S1/P1 nuclease n=1 Tax=Mucilaginibacter sp. FT3.2 TaxID=2723090 RepID=UPI00160F5DFA|nr:S1/P1 nuclease [Mucilaginibacter sp. FT3.2]MBB6234293.1 hypothetical protein [Mucilaginibacter sp. FT3.2]
MRKYILPVSLVILVIGLASWGAKGHRAVATIAEKHLSANTSKVVAYYLKGESMTDASSWADEIRGDQKYRKTFSWHFLNLPLGLSRDQFVEAVGKQDKDNIYTAILKAEANLKDQGLTTDQKNEALKFLIHLVGDAHQPMHVSRAEDKGGNDIQVRYDNNGTNLHSLWDSKMIDHEGLNNVEMAQKYDWANVAQIKKWQNDSPMQWLWESYQISSELYADIKPGETIDEDYYKKSIAVIHLRIEQAGIRLAGELNKLLENEHVNITDVRLAPPTQADKLEVKGREVKLEDVKSQTGKEVSVKGKVFTIKDIGSMVLVNLGAAYPEQLLTIALKGKAKDLAAQIDGKVIRVEGTVIDYKGKPEIIIVDPARITIMK